jgi:hypothetical protein
VREIRAKCLADQARNTRNMFPASTFVMETAVLYHADANRFGWNPEHMGQARAFFDRAVALDPGNIEALVATAVLDVTSVLAFLADDPATRLASAEAIFNRVLSLAPDHAWRTAIWELPKPFPIVLTKELPNSNEHWS